MAEPSFRISSPAEHSTFGWGKNGGPIGPSTSSKEAMRTKVAACLDLIHAGEIGTADNAVDVLLAHRFRLDVLDQAFSSHENGKTGREKFYLKHPDDKRDHILANADFDIVGIIDWEWCSTASKEEAFSTPCMMWPVAKFYDGSNELAEEEVLLAEIYRDKGRDDLAEYVLKGRQIQDCFLRSVRSAQRIRTKRRLLVYSWE